MPRGDSAPWLLRAASRFTVDRSVVLCQFPLTLIVVVVGVTSPALGPALLSDRMFELGFSLTLVLLALGAVVPWSELPRGGILVLPTLDFAAIALVHAGAAESLPGLGVLAVLPVIWLMRSSLPLWAALTLTGAGTLLVTALPGLAGGGAPGPAGVALLPVVMLCVGTVVRVTTMGALVRERELERKDDELGDLLRAAIERERLLTAILDTVDVGFTAVDAHGNTTLTNRQQELFNRLSYGSGHEGATRVLLFGADRTTELPVERRPVYRALTGETFADELVWVGDGEAQRALSTAARPIKNADGGITGALIVCSDVTELVEAVNAKDTFISNISHEFHAPLTSVLGYLELVLEDEHTLPNHLTGYVDVAGRNAERVLHLVADLLSTAGDRVRVHPRPVDLAALIEMSVRSNRLRAEKNDVTLRSSAVAPLWTLLDPLRISQVLDNLLSNAIKYSPGGGVVSILAEETPSAINLHVEDRGIGMTEQEARLVFSRFYRTPSARKADIDGAGLGLAITKSIVESHGGSIHCVSAPGEGSRFTVILPVNGEVGRVSPDPVQESV